MKKLYYMAVLFQMFHVGIIRIRRSNVLIPVSLQVTLNGLCHGSSVKTPHMNKEQLDANNSIKHLLQLSPDQTNRDPKSISNPPKIWVITNEPGRKMLFLFFFYSLRADVLQDVRTP